MGPTRLDPLDHARTIVLQCLLKDAYQVTSRRPVPSFRTALRIAQLQREHGPIPVAVHDEGRYRLLPVAMAGCTLMLAALAIWFVIYS